MKKKLLLFLLILSISLTSCFKDSDDEILDALPGRHEQQAVNRDQNAVQTVVVLSHAHEKELHERKEK